MIRAYRTYDEIVELLIEEGFEPTALVFSDTRVGSVTLKVSGIHCGAMPLVTFYAKPKDDNTAFGFPTLREAFKHLGIE